MEVHNKGKGDRSKWELPKGYKGKYEIAKAKAKAQKRVNQLDSGGESDCTEGDDWEDSDSDIMGPSPGQRCRALRQTCNALVCGDCDALDTQLDDDFPPLCNSWAHIDEKEDLVNYLQGFAHKVEIKVKRQPKAEQTSVLIGSIHQLETFINGTCKVANIAAPTGKRKMKKMASHLPDIHLEDDEMVALVDSGSTINAAHIAKHFAKYVRHIISSRAQCLGETATTAGGHELKNEGRVCIEASVDGVDFPIPFQNMKVDVPIISVRKYVKTGWKFGFDEDGGFMKNKSTGRVLHFIESDGAYWIKLKIHQPDPSVASLGFTRPGNP
jgi:hypothetical protein